MLQPYLTLSRSSPVNYQQPQLTETSGNFNTYEKLAVSDAPKASHEAPPHRGAFCTGTRSGSSRAGAAARGLRMFIVMAITIRAGGISGKKNSMGSHRL